jgi:uncharacterized NAD-dependent epimerase/dehydratase family protein
MNALPEGNAIVYCEGAFGTPNGKTAHGLVRRTDRYRILSVVDARHAGKDAGEMLDGRPNSIPIHGSIQAALKASRAGGHPATHLVIGLAPDGGRLTAAARQDIRSALLLRLNVDSGLHDFLSDDPDLAVVASRQGVTIRDVRKPPPRELLHFFNGNIEKVHAFKVAVLGTDSAVGKRTTAWVLLDALRASGHRTELIGTGQTAWMQGARYGIILDSLVNDFVSGEIEHAIWTAWEETRPDVILLEGQGSLMNPAYPGGFELLAAGRPDAVILQHAPARKDYDGFPGYPIHALETQIRAIELLSGRPVVAVSVNHEGLTRPQIPGVCADIASRTGLPACDVLEEGAAKLVAALTPYLNKRQRGQNEKA